MNYKVTADAHYEFDIEADGEDEAIDMAQEELLEQAYPLGNAPSLFEWSTQLKKDLNQ